MRNWHVTSVQPFVRSFAIGLLALVTALIPVCLQRVAAQSPVGTIAYVRPNATTGLEIRLVEPDGTNDRRLWSVGRPDPDGLDKIWGLSWRPDASELTFAGTHERNCSLYQSDIYGIGADGSNYRRIVQGPACDHLAGYPKGTVTVKVKNNSLEAGTFFIYFQGAPGVKMLPLAVGGEGSVTFTDVADFGAGKPQWAVAIEGGYRWINTAMADVQPGGAVETPQLQITGEGLYYGVDYPTWHRDGSRLAFLFGFSTLNQIEADPPPGHLGDPLLMADVFDMPQFVNFPTWGPTAALENQLLYAGDDPLEGVRAIYLVAEGSSDRGEPLATLDWDENSVLGLTWLPDGSGFLYSVESFWGGSRLYEYSFASNQAQLRAEFEDYVGGLSVSPDGQWVVAHRTTSLSGDAPVDLWTMRPDGSQMSLLVENGYYPAWSPQDLSAPSPTPSPTATPPSQPTPPPTQPDYRLFLPLTVRHR